MRNVKRPDYSFQKSLEKDAIRDMRSTGTCVLAAGCGAGKTNMAISIAKRYLDEGLGRRILVLTHGQSHLRTQFAERIQETKAKFSFQQMVKASAKLTKQVTVTLPQTLNAAKRYPEGEVDLLIVDEAHHYYFSKMVQSIIKYYKPKHQLLLTGSPSPFIRAGGFPMVSVSSGELLKHGVIADPEIQLVRANYTFKESDYGQDMELRETYKFAKHETVRITKDVIGKIVKIQKRISKTLIACKNKRQASDVLRTLKALKVKSTMSVSGVDFHSEEIRKFVRDPRIQALVVVGRGILGFNMAELMNVVDLSGSHNPDRCFQLLSRAVRRHGDTKKIVP